MCIFNYLEHTIAFDERKIFGKPNIGLNIYTLEIFRDSKRLDRAVKCNFSKRDIFGKRSKTIHFIFRL